MSWFVILFQNSRNLLHAVVVIHLPFKSNYTPNG